MFVETPSPESDSDDSESLGDVMAEFKAQMEEIDRATKSISTQVTQLYARAKEETTDWLTEPLVPKPALKAWLKSRGMSTRISVEEFLDVSTQLQRLWIWSHVF
jgi:predicted transcriptional regulator